jgi:hypothetical protein
MYEYEVATPEVSRRLMVVEVGYQLVVEVVYNLLALNLLKNCN